VPSLFTPVAITALLSGSAPAASDVQSPRIEARVYFDDVRTLRQLGDLAGQLDVCTWVEDKLGGYLLIDTDSSQLEEIRAAGLLVDVTYPDIRQKFYEMTGVRPGNLAVGRDFGYFLTYGEVQDTLAKLVLAYPGICTTFSLGLSFQGRPLWCLKISDNASVAEDEPACFFNGATHAREPLSTNCCVTFAARLLSGYNSDSISTWLVNNRETYIVPVMNPDGYVYNSDSGGAASNWRKNRHSPVPPNIGVDLNRNYGYKWGYDYWGSSGRPWDETYRGPAPFSEPETQVIRDFLATYRPRDCLDLHTFGQYNMYPWGYSRAEPPDQAALRRVVDTFQNNNHYPRPHTNQVYAAIYPCNGMSVDWEYSDTAGKFVTYAFTCELGTTDFWYGWLDSAYINRECDLNVPNLYYLARVAGAYLEGLSARLDDSLTGNGDGRFDPDELSRIWFTIRNQAIHPLDSAYGITARLVSETPCVEVLDSVMPFPNARRSETVDNCAAQFRIRTSHAVSPGAHIPLRLELSFTDAGHTYTQTVDFLAPTWRQPVSASATSPGLTRLTATPNPAHRQVNFSTTPVTASGRLDVFSPVGSLVASRAVSGMYIWDCSRVTAGIYFCRLTADGESASTRVGIVH
jgi:hypothetical protein